MKENYFITSKKLFLFLLMVSFSGYSQISGAHFTITLANPTNPTSSSFEVDVVLVVDPTGTALAQGGSRISGVSVGVMFNPSILNGGTPSTLTNGGVWTLIPGTRDASLAGLSFAQDGTYRGIFNNYGQLRIVGAALAGQNSVNLGPGTYSIGRYQFINTVAFPVDSEPQLWISPNNAGGATNTLVATYPYGMTTPAYSYTTTLPTGAPGLTLPYTQSNPLPAFRLNSLSSTAFQLDALNVIAIPNPFVSNFKLNISTTGSDEVVVKIYDMLGRELESTRSSAVAISNMTIGDYYPAGVYTIVVNQGDKSKSLRVIKR